RATRRDASVLSPKRLDHQGRRCARRARRDDEVGSRRCFEEEQRRSPRCSGGRLARHFGDRTLGLVVTREERNTMKTVESTFSKADVQELIDVRRDLHANPETAFEEVRTSGIVAAKLKAMGLEPRVQVGRTGVLATVKGGRAGK